MTTISDERLAEIVGAEVPCVPIEPWEVAHVVQELRALRAQGGVTVDPALLQGICDSLRAAIHEYEDMDMFPGARTIMQAQLDAILSSLEASPAPVSGEMGLEQKLNAFIAWTKRHPADWGVGMVRVNGVFQRFMDHDTDTAWLGFEAALAAKGGQ